MAPCSDTEGRDCNSCGCKSPLFELLDKNELTLVNNNKNTIHFKKGETIRKQGAPMTHVISLSSGLAKLYVEGFGDRNAILRIVKPTNFIGGPGIYYDQLHHFTITALMDTTVCFIDMQVFKQIISQNKTFAEEFMKDFSKNTLSVYQRLINLTQKQMPGRMADALIYLSGEIFRDNKISRIITNQDIADLSGMSKDSAAKVLRELDKENIIRLSDTEIGILSKDALDRLSRVG
jgi:CRP/FNR family transcriptional regulator, polysaccharide utilization system transcription regulator